ncbi:hypothetical protein HYU45_02380 [Candidatus Daviesbacteria bacterium]|nr:hypothetical protein [Candidatus Daviesbacteria bacterium]
MVINTLLQFFLGTIFLILAVVCFTLPGHAILRKLTPDLDDLEKFTIASVFGLVIFTLAAYVLAAIHLRFLMWTFPLIGIWSLYNFRKEIFSFRLKISHKIVFLLVFLMGVIGMVAVNAPSGFPYREGIYFWSSHGHDGVWHLALMEQMKTSNFPFQNPELAGAKLQNYHFFVDLLMSEFSRLFQFSSLDIYFRFMPVVFAALLGLASFIFVRAWGKSEVAGIWAMFFTSFAGSFGYLLYIPTHLSLGGESIFWVSQTQSVLGNPPHAAAFIITTAFLFCFLKYLKSKKLIFFLLCTILGGVVIEFKVYAGMLILGGLFLAGIFELFFKRKFQVIFLFLSIFLVSFIIYFPNSKNSQDFLLWQPWWFIRTMVVAPDRLNWIDLELRRQTYIAEENWKRVIQVEATAFLIFLFGNLGMRFVGFWTYFKKVKENLFKNNFNIFFLGITTASFFVPVFFLQKGVAWNTIQFNQYFLLFFGFLAAITTAELLLYLKNISLRYLLSGLIILLSVPTQLGLLWQFYSNPALSKVSYEEIEALKFLKKVSADAIVLTSPFNRYERDKYNMPPIPIYAWYDTGYVSAFSGKKTLISDEEQVNIMGYKVDKLLLDRSEAFESTDHQKMNSFLKKYKIDYIYLVWDQKIATSSSFLDVDSVFENKDARIFKVRK